MVEQNHKPKVLVEAYECSPIRAHAPGAAWQILSRLAKWYNLWVITEETQYRNEVTDYLKSNPVLAEHMHFLFIPRLKKEGFGRKRPALPIREVLEYRRWLKRSFVLAKQLQSKINFDLVHHLRGDSFREPGYLWKLSVPFIWGPTGGTASIPWRMLTTLDSKAMAEYAVRNVANAFQFHFSPRVRNACYAAKRILAQTTEDQKNFSKVHSVETLMAHEQGCDPSMASLHYYDGTRKLNVAWVGRCIPGKAMPILLKAVSKQEIKGRITLHIVGDGPCFAKWQILARDLGIAGQCKWHGWLEQQKTLDLLNSCDVLAFTSLLEATSTTVMQALSLGVPVICMKLCGFGDVITDECGIVIPVKNSRSAVEGFSAALGSILQKPKILEELSKGALRQAEKYSWDSIAQQVKDAYDMALTSSARREALTKVGSPIDTEVIANL